MTCRRNLLILSLLTLLASSLSAQPRIGDIKELQSKYQAEREQVVKNGTAQRFLPILLERADEMARKGAAALADGRLAQAHEAFRQARWQLPYQSPQVPDHVARILGSQRLRHGRGVRAVAFNPNGKRLLTAGGDGLVKVWDLGNGHELLTYAGHGASDVRFLALTPDGKTVVSAGDDKQVKVWEADSGKDHAGFEVAGQKVSALALSRDGKFVLVGIVTEAGGQSQGALSIYETLTGKVRRTDNDFRGRITSIALNPAGTVLAVGDETGQMRLWQLPQMLDNPNLPAYWSQQDQTGSAYAIAFSPDGQTLARCGQHDVKLYNVAAPGENFQVATPKRVLSLSSTAHSILYSKDGKTLFTGDGDGVIRAWDAGTAQTTGTFRGHTGMVWSLALHPAGNVLASASQYDYLARLWDFDVTPQSQDLVGHTSAVWMAGFSPDGRKIVSAGADRTLKVWDAVSGKVLHELGPQKAAVTAALFSPDGKLIASAGGDKIVRLWDAATGQPLRTCEGHQGPITTLDFSPDSKRLASGGADRSVHLWEVATGKPALPPIAMPAVVAALAFSPDGKELAIGGIDHSVTILDAATGKQQHRWVAHSDAVTCLAYSPDGQYLATGGADGALQVWLCATPGVAAIRMTSHAGPVSMVAFRKDNQHLVSGGSDQVVRLWKIEGNAAKELQTFKGHKDWVTAVGFSRDGFHVVSASVDKSIKVWEITSRDMPVQPEHASAVETVVCSPDGKLLASGSDDSTIKLWDRATGAELATLTGHPNPVVSLAFTPDGKTLVSSGEEAAIRLWQVSPPREIERTAGQMQSFNHLRRYSPYIFVEPEGKKLYVWLPLNEARISTMVECYDLREGKQLFQFFDDNRKVNSLAFCANGKLAASGARDGSVRLYDLQQQGAILKGGDWHVFDKAGVKEPTVGVADLALTPDGKTLVVTSDEGEIKVGDVATRTFRTTFKGHDRKIMACITSPDGKRAATVALDNIIKLWDLQTGHELRRWSLGRAATDQYGLLINSLVFTPDSRQLVTANADTTVYLLELP